MNYTIATPVVKSELSTIQGWLERNRLGWIWKPLCPVAVTLVYFGILGAPAFCVLLPYNFMEAVGASTSTTFYWSVLSLNIVGVSALCVWIFHVIWHHLQARIIQVEFILVLLSLLLALWFLVYGGLYHNPHLEYGAHE